MKTVNLLFETNEEFRKFASMARTLKTAGIFGENTIDFINKVVKGIEDTENTIKLLKESFKDAYYISNAYDFEIDDITYIALCVNDNYDHDKHYSNCCRTISDFTEQNPLEDIKLLICDFSLGSFYWSNKRNTLKTIFCNKNFYAGDRDEVFSKYSLYPIIKEDKDGNYIVLNNLGKLDTVKKEELTKKHFNLGVS